MHPGGFREGTGVLQAVDGTIHNIALLVPTSLGQTYTEGTPPLVSGEAVVEVSLFSYSIFARLLAIVGSAGCVNRSGMHHRCAAPFFAPLCERLYL